MISKENGKRRSRIDKGGNYLIPCCLITVTVPMSNGTDFIQKNYFKLLFGRNCGGEGQNKKAFIDGYSPDTSPIALPKLEKIKNKFKK